MPDESSKTQPAAAGAESFITRLKQGAKRSHEQAGETPSLQRDNNDPPQDSDEYEKSFNPHVIDWLTSESAVVPHMASAKVRTVACMITHGMGEQVPFETIAAAASAFVRGRVPASPPQANRVALVPDGDLVSRMELCYAATEETPETHVHIYEGYWAPLTEGRITYKSIISFLFSTGLAGLRVARRKRFNRWIFGNLYELPIKLGTEPLLLGILVALLLLSGLVVFASFEVDHVWTVIKGFANLGFAQGFHALFARAGSHPWKCASLLLVIPLAWIAYQIHWFLVEYVGDVVIYVASYKVSVYEEVRDAIQKTVLDLGKQIVACTNPLSPLCGPVAKEKHGGPSAPPFVYDGIFFAGHSLGSVITFDLINALIVWDTDGCGGRHDLINRITRLLTFGSPLDKTAFLFRTQVSTEQHHFRELMAGNIQPLTLDYELRPFPWINLYSHKDPVSGCLQYYDLPPGMSLPALAARVDNRIDPAGTKFGEAHVQYWDGMMLSEQLLHGVGLTLDTAGS
jgi:hypothetical protein